MERKGFPESYDRLALLKFVADIKSGVERVVAPVYSHLSYDIVPGAEAVVSLGLTKSGTPSTCRT